MDLLKRKANRALAQGRFPVEDLRAGRRQLTPEETQAWGERAQEHARETAMLFLGTGDGYIYGIFQDRAQSGLVDTSPIFARIPVALVAPMLAQLAQLGAQIKVEGPAQPDGLKH